MATTLRGKVLYVKRNDDGLRWFGFIVPHGLNGTIDRDQNVWFGPKSVDLAAPPRSGATVTYELETGPRKHQGPRALRVWPDIVTIEGEFNT